MASEKELDGALASAFATDPEFMDWFVSHTKFAGRGAVYCSCRANNPWGTHPFTYTDPVSGNSIATTRQSETDVLLIAVDRDGNRLGIHIEDKLAGGTFTEFQPQMCAHRAAFWLGKEHYGGYTEFDTVLLAPDSFRRHHEVQAEFFGCFVSHEEVARYVPLFAQ